MKMFVGVTMRVVSCQKPTVDDFYSKVLHDVIQLNLTS